MSDVNIWGGTGSGGAGITLPLQVAQGGTGAIDVATALSNLGIYSKAEIDSLVLLLVAKTSSSGSAIIPSGTTAQRDASPVFGALRANSTLAKIEWYDGTNWISVGSGSGGSSGIFQENAIIQDVDYTLSTGANAVSAGPVTIADGVTVIIPAGSTWTIV